MILRCIVLLLGLVQALWAQEPAATRFSVSPKGFVTSWLVRGPFPDPGRTNRDVDFLRDDGGESAVPAWKVIAGQAVAKGATNDNRAWRLHLSTRYFIDFLPVMQPGEEGIAYALTWVESPSEQSVFGRLGSDDGVKVWVNGQLVHDNPVYRGMRVDEDVFPVHLSPGLNSVLVKVNQGVGDWRFCLRFTSRADEPVQNLTVLLPRLLDDGALRQFAASAFRVSTLLTEEKRNRVFRFSLSYECGMPVVDTRFEVVGRVKDIDGRELAQVFEMETRPGEPLPGPSASWRPKRLKPGMYILETKLYEAPGAAGKRSAAASAAVPIFWY